MMTALLCFPLVTASVVTPRASSCTYVRRHVAGTSPRRHVRDTRRTYVTRGVRSPSSAGAYANNLLAWLGGCEVVGKESADDVWACAPPPVAPHVYTYVDLYPSMPSTHAELDGCELQGGMLPSPSLAIERLQSRNSLTPVTPVCPTLSRLQRQQGNLALPRKEGHSCQLRGRDHKRPDDVGLLPLAQHRPSVEVRRLECGDELGDEHSVEDPLC